MSTCSISYDNYDDIEFFCLAHYNSWRSRLEWLLNKIRLMPDQTGVIPVEYLQRVPKLVCNCKDRLEQSPHEDPWINVTADDIVGSLKFIRNYIEQHIDNAHAPVFKRFINLLETSFMLADRAEHAEGYSEASCLKLMYLLQKAVEKDYTIFEPPARRNLEYEPEKQEKSLSFELEGFNHTYMVKLIGSDGSHIEPFAKQFKCQVKLSKLQDGETFKVLAKISKKTASESVLEKIKEELIVKAKRLQESEDEKAKQRSQSGGATVTTAIPDLPSVGSEEDTDPKSSTAAAAGATTSVPETASLSTATASVLPSSSPSTSSHGTASATTQLSVPQAASASSVSPSTGKSSVPFWSRQSSAVVGSKMSKQADERSVDCIVHNRRWTSTFQFVVTRCTTEVKLPRNKRQKFCDKICTCSEREASTIKLEGRAKIQTLFDNVRRHISTMWPQETHIVTKSLVKQLEKPEVWPSLYKFVVYYGYLELGNMSFLDDGNIPPEVKNMNTGPVVAATARRPSTDSGGSVSSFMSASSNEDSSPHAVPHAMQTASATVKTEAASPKPKQFKLKRVAPQEWSDDCFFHGPKRKCVFQCVLNHLHKDRNFPHGLNVPFSAAVCCCGETTAFSDFYGSQEACIRDCRFMKDKLSAWKRESKASVQPLIRQLSDLVSGNQVVSDGYLKFVYHYKAAFEYQHNIYIEIKKAMSRSK